MKINREELKQYLLNNFDCYADMDEHYDAEVIPALTIGQAVDLFEQYVSELANTNETPNKHKTEQLNILGVSKQRELLIAFTEWFKENGGFPIEDWEVKKYAEGFIKSNL